MVKVTNAIVAATLIAGPALAFTPQEHSHQRVTGRELSDFELTTRDILSSLDLAGLSERDFDDLYEREPIIGAIARGAKNVVSSIFGREIESLDDLSERELHELYEREPSIFTPRGDTTISGPLSFFKGPRDFADDADLTTREALDALYDLEERELLELYEREPIIGHALKAVKGIFGFRREFDGLEELTERDLQDLYERDPNVFKKIIGGIGKAAKGIFGFRRELESLSARDLEELEEREPIVGHLLRGAKSILGFRRDFDELEVAERDWDASTLDELD